MFGSLPRLYASHPIVVEPFGLSAPNHVYYTMARTVKRTHNNRLSVKYAEANRVRLLLLSEDIQTLSKRDVHTLLKILDDVYPVREHKPGLAWQPLLIGIGIGLILVIAMALVL